MTTPEKIFYSPAEPVNRDLMPGGAIRFVHSENVTFAIWDFGAGTVVPAHAHPHDQVTHCTDGELIVTVDDQVYTLGPGETVVIPPGSVHSARADVPARGVDVFHPVREDYKF
jgi:quercetin dioxygenase-like cupin family protein